MRRGRLTLTILLVALAFLSVGLGLFGLIVLRRSDVALTGALFLLGLAQLVSIVWRRREPEAYRAELLEQRRRIDELSREINKIGQSHDHVSALAGRLEPIERQLSALEHAAIDNGRLEQRLTDIQVAIDTLIAARLRPEPARPNVRVASPALQVELYLEPIVRIKEARTVYYRASLAELRPDGSPVQARRTPALDLECFRQVIPIARRFRARNRVIGIFCPLSPASFSDSDFIAELLDLLRQERDVAGSLVIDITQKGLGSLEEGGLEGLAWLAELGATFSLSRTDIAGPDVPALAHLGFQFLDIEAGIIAKAAAASSPALRDAVLRLFRQSGEHGVSVVAAEVTHESELEAVLSYASLARGPLFSPPRRVRHEAGHPTLESAVA